MLLLQTPSNSVSIVLNQYEWIFPACEIFHIVGFGVSIGTIAVVDFSLLGLEFKSKAAPRLLKDTWPWTLIALVIVLMAGFVLFLTDPVGYINNSSFRVKMVALLLAIVFNYTIHRTVAMSSTSSPGVNRFVAALSLALWLSVVASGLLIAFVGG